MPDRVLTCTAYDDASGTCTVQVWAEPPTVLPPLSVEEAKDIATAALLAFALVMAAKVALRKSQ